MDESELVARVAEYLRGNGWVVIVARPSQTKVYFTMSNGKRKAPDLVAWKSGEIMVAEAKCLPSHLFTASGASSSDVDCLLQLKIESIWLEFLEVIYRRLRIMGLDFGGPTCLTLGLIAASGFSAIQQAKSEGFVRISSAPSAPITFS